MNNETKTLTIKEEIQQWAPSIQQKAPSWVNKSFCEQMITCVGMEIHKNKALSQCSHASIKECIFQLAMIGLIPSRVTGHAFLIPFGRICSLIIGYKGFITLLCRDQNIVGIEARIVYEKDKFLANYGTNPSIEHVPTFGDKGKIIGSYATVVYSNGYRRFEFMEKSEVDKIKSKAKSRKFWDDHYEQMAKKTAIRRLANYMPNIALYQKLLSVDNDSYNSNGITEEKRESIENNSDEKFIISLEKEQKESYEAHEPTVDKNEPAENIEKIKPSPFADIKAQLSRKNNEK